MWVKMLSELTRGGSGERFQQMTLVGKLFCTTASG